MQSTAVKAFSDFEKFEELGWAYAVFRYTTTHARDGPAAFLKGFKGYLQADGYGAYDGIDAMIGLMMLRDWQ